MQPDGTENDRLLRTLEHLLQVQTTDQASALDEAAQLIADGFGADKVDVWFRDDEVATLEVRGLSQSPMSADERRLGLDRLPLVEGGRVVEVFRTGQSYLTGHADEDPEVRRGFVDGLGVRSMMCAPLVVGGARRGILLVSSATPERFSPADLRLLEAIARWVGVVAHQAELVEQVALEAAERGRRQAAEELITVLAHDLRNHLSGLRGRLELLRRRAERDGQDRYVADASALLTSVDRFGRLIGDLLDVGRLEQGLFGIAPQPIDLVPLVREAATAFDSEAIPVVVHAKADELRVSADPARLRQALENLLSNAVKHSSTGSPIGVEVATEERDPQQWATVAVSDEGPGIAPEVLPRLFERFARGPGSMGLGLGLYLAQQIAEAHGGSVEVESTVGAGSRFTLCLPLDP